MKTWLEENWFKLLAIVMVLGALPSVFPMMYYQLMNWVVMIVAFVSAKQAHKRGSTWLMAPLALVAIIFNPLAPFYLRADIWQIADVIVAILFVISVFIIREQKEN